MVTVSSAPIAAATSTPITPQKPMPLKIAPATPLASQIANTAITTLRTFFSRWSRFALAEP